MKASIDKLKEYFAQGCKKDKDFNIGLEVEHFVLHKDSRQTMRFDGPDGLGRQMEMMAEDYSNTHMEEGAIIALEDADTLITLEPGCQVEISTAPFSSVEKVMGVYRQARLGMEKKLELAGYHMVTEGYLPFGKAEDVPLIPKQRYQCMDQYFQESGIYGRNMMRATAACHVSVDYFSEKDFVRKYRLAWLLNPLFALLTENVSVFEDQPYEGHLLRDQIWQGVDQERVQPCGDLFDKNFGFKSYARWLLNVPAIVVNHNGEYIYERRKTIGECMDTYGDSEALISHYLSMVFPDIRLKQFIEIRSADSMPEIYVRAYCSLIKGLFMNPKTVEGILDLLPQTLEALIEAKEHLKQDGYEAFVYGQPVRLMLMWLLREASENLEEEESGYLDLWYPVIESGKGIQGVTLE